MFITDCPLPCLFSSLEMAVALQFRVLQSAVEFIRTTASQEPQKPSGSANNPSSPHHAMYQKRKSIAGESPATAACRTKPRRCVRRRSDLPDLPDLLTLTSCPHRPKVPSP